MKTIKYITCLFFIPCFVGCFSTEYMPTDNSVSVKNLTDVKADIKRSLSTAKLWVMFGDAYGWAKRTDLKISKDKLELTVESLKGEMKNISIAYSGLEIPSIKDFGSSGAKMGARYTATIKASEITFNWNDLNDAKLFVNALYCLKNKKYKNEIPKIEEAFKLKAEQYRALETKPLLPEEARKYIVQAENAMEEKRYDDAIELYAKAIAVDPMQPIPHYNFAYLLSGVGRFGEAIVEMKKYLLLNPDAPDARSAQDNIYVWELKMKE